MELKIIAYAHNGHTDKFGIPRQSREESPILTRIVFEPEYRVPEALRGIDGFSHLWILWGFTEIPRNYPDNDPLVMQLFDNLKQAFSKEPFNAQQAQEMAHLYSWGPVIFQVCRLMIKYGILDMLNEHREGLTQAQIVDATGLSEYAVKCLLEASLTTHIVLINPKTDTYRIAKAGWFLLRDAMIRVDIDFNHDVNYEGWFVLDKALEEGRPAGLKHFGDWPTIYEGLSSLPADVQKSSI